MKQRFDFEEIRPLYDEEVPEMMPSLLEEPAMKSFLKYIRPDMPFEEFREVMLQMKSKTDFQRKLVAPFLHQLALKTSDSLCLDGTERLDKDESYTFISNHRDIILDAAFLNILLFDHGRDTAEVAIGDNLLVFPWIRTLVRMNKSFIVKRNLPVRQLLEVSRRLSAYINFALKIKHQSVWIAQREGRSKDSSDHTQESVIKMLAMSGDANFLKSVRGLNIAPVAISYEYDPCDYLKAREFQIKRDCPDYKKPEGEDLKNMENGLTGYKGNIRFCVAGPLNPHIEHLTSEMDKSEQIACIVSTIDDMIHRNMTLYPGNYVAYDLRFDVQTYASHYTTEQQQRFEQYLQSRLDLIDLPQKDIPFLKGKLLEMYSNPVVNMQNIK